MEPSATPDTSITTLLKGIVTDVQTLLREELALARVELTRHAAQMKTAGLQFAAAAGAMTIAGVLLLIALALGLADAFAWPAWAGFLAVGLFLSVIGLACYLMARRRLDRVTIVPEETVMTLKENSAWIARRLSSEQR